jgi:hypothetical protein
MKLQTKIEHAIESYIAMMIESYDDYNMIGDQLAYHNIDWDIDNITVGYKSMGLLQDLGDNVLCLPVGEIELYQFTKPMSKARADYLNSVTDYYFKIDGTVIVNMGYDVITFTNKAVQYEG